MMVAEGSGITMSVECQTDQWGAKRGDELDEDPFPARPAKGPALVPASAPACHRHLGMLPF